MLLSRARLARTDAIQVGGSLHDAIQVEKSVDKHVNWSEETFVFAFVSLRESEQQIFLATIPQMDRQLLKRFTCLSRVDFVQGLQMYSIESLDLNRHH